MGIWKMKVAGWVGRMILNQIQNFKLAWRLDEDFEFDLIWILYGIWNFELNANFMLFVFVHSFLKFRSHHFLKVNKKFGAQNGLVLVMTELVLAPSLTLTLTTHALCILERIKPNEHR